MTMECRENAHESRARHTYQLLLLYGVCHYPPLRAETKVQSQQNKRSNGRLCIQCDLWWGDSRFAHGNEPDPTYECEVGVSFGVVKYVAMGRFTPEDGSDPIRPLHLHQRYVEFTLVVTRACLWRCVRLSQLGVKRVGGMLLYATDTAVETVALAPWWGECSEDVKGPLWSVV